MPLERKLKLLVTADLSEAVKEMDSVHRDPITCVAWSAHGDCLATASRDCVAVWSTVWRQNAMVPEDVSRRFALDATPQSLLWNEMALALGTGVGSIALLSTSKQQRAQEEAVEKPEQEGEQLGPEADDAHSHTTASAIPCTPHSQTTKGAEAGQPSEQVESQPKRTTCQQDLLHPGASKEQGRRRILAWNEHGMLKVFTQQDLGKHATSQSRRVMAALGPESQSHVEVEYSRVPVGPLRARGPRDFAAPAGLQLGALGPSACALAAQPTASEAAKVMVHVADPWRKSCFTHLLPAGEEVQAITMSSEFVALATSPHRYLRIHTLSGITLGVLALPGDIVCLVAGGDLLLCVTRADPCTQSPDLDFALYGVEAKERLVAGRLPLSPESALRWAGFTSEALPLCLDTSGVLRALVLAGTTEKLVGAGAGDWLPVAQLEKGGKNLWPVYAESKALQCAPLEKPGADPKVGATLRLSEVRFRLPLDSEKPALEKILRHNLFRRHHHFAHEAHLLATPQKRRVEHGTEGSVEDRVEKQRRKEEKEKQKRKAERLDEERAAVRQCLSSVGKLCNDRLTAGDLHQAYDIARLFFFAVQGSSRAETLQLLTSARHAATLHKQDELWSQFRQLHEEISNTHPEAEAHGAAAQENQSKATATTEIHVEAPAPQADVVDQPAVSQAVVDTLEAQRKTIAANRAKALERKRMLEAQKKESLKQQ